MAELKKRKKSLNMLVNPTSQPSIVRNKSPLYNQNTSGFKPVQNKSLRLKKTPLDQNSTCNLSQNQTRLLGRSENDLFCYSQRAMTQREDKGTIKQNITLQPQQPFYFNKTFNNENKKPDYKRSNDQSYQNISEQNVFLSTRAKERNSTPKGINFEIKESTMIVESSQETTNKKLFKTSLTNSNNNLLEFSNNSSKTQVILAHSNQKPYKTTLKRKDSKASDYSLDAPDHVVCNLDANSAMQFESQDNFLICNEQFDTNMEALIQQKNEQMTFEEEPTFVSETNNVNDFDNEALDILIRKEQEYSCDPNYFKTKQRNVTPFMRAILIDWIMEVCNEFTLKRETFHLAVNYVDRYMSIVVNVSKSELQLIGIVAMFIASKVEEVYPPKLKDFARSADNSFTIQQIQLKEEEFLKTLKFMVNPPTTYLWANWFMTQWDLYIDNSSYAKNHQINSYANNSIHFKQPKEDSYALFRELMQLIDCSILDVETLQYKPRALILSFIYLVIGKSYKQFTDKQIAEEMCKCNANLLSKEYLFNDLFANFLEFSIGADICELLPYIQYCSKLFNLKLNYELPIAVKINKQYVLEGHFEEFLAYQTHNSENLEFTKNRLKRNK